MATSIAHSVKIEFPLDAIILESNNGKMDKGVKVVNTKGASEKEHLKEKQSITKKASKQPIKLTFPKQEIGIYG